MIQPFALQVRALWMRIAGIPEEEIGEYCNPSEPADLEEELRELAAARRLAARRITHDEMRLWVRRESA